MKQKHATTTLSDEEFLETGANDMKQRCECTIGHHEQLHKWNDNNTVREDHDSAIQKILQQGHEGPLVRMTRRTERRIPPWRRNGQLQDIDSGKATGDAAARITSTEKDWAELGAVSTTL